MPLFRFHRGGLKESLATTIIVKSFNDMIKAIVMDNSVIDANPKWGARFLVEPYPNEENNFDPSIGWYTQVVTINLYEEDKMHPIGFLSEPF
jgi:hypothetical protein